MRAWRGLVRARARVRARTRVRLRLGLRPRLGLRLRLGFGGRLTGVLADEVDAAGRRDDVRALAAEVLREERLARRDLGVHVVVREARHRGCVCACVCGVALGLMTRPSFSGFSIRGN